jgi:cytochrome c553
MTEAGIHSMKAVLVAAICALAPLQARAGDIPQSRFDELKMDCDTCHGTRGVSVVPDQTPSIAGKSERYLLSQLRAFQSGKRRHDTMGLMGNVMSEDEMKAIAHYYSRVRR